MPNDRDLWSGYAKQHSGNLVVWVDQTSDTGLKAVNSNGVCHALTKAWVEAYVEDLESRSMFVNSFRDQPKNNPIPQDYLENQAIYAQQLETYNSTLAQVKSSSDKEFQRKMLPLLKKSKSDLYPDGTKVSSLKAGTDVANVVLGMPHAPSYIMLSMRGKGAHVVGFEIRPDHHVSENYPAVYEYFDANLGLFAFGKFKNMLDFFLTKVWQNLYRPSFFGCAWQVACLGVRDGVGFTSCEKELELELAALYD